MYDSETGHETIAILEAECARLEAENRRIAAATQTVTAAERLALAHLTNAFMYLDAPTKRDFFEHQGYFTYADLGSLTVLANKVAYPEDSDAAR